MLRGIVTSGSPFLPASEITLVYFVAHLSDTVSFKTIKTYLAGVGHLHLLFNTPFGITKMPLLSQILRGVKRIQGINVRERRPVTVEIMSKLHICLNPNYTCELDSVMFWAAFTLAFFGFLRCSEFTCDSVFDPEVHMTITDIIFEPIITNPSCMLVKIKKSKTDPFRQGSLLTIAASSSHVCAVKAMKNYILQASPIAPDKPLFRLQNGRPLTRTLVSTELRRLLAMCGLDTSAYATHSFRIGAATTAAASGIPAWLIKTMGRWSSDCYERYIRTPSELIKTVPETMVKKLGQQELAD